MDPPRPLSFPSDGDLVSVGPSSRRTHLLMKEEPNEGSPPFLVPPSHGDISPPAPAPVNRDQSVYVTEAPQIHDLDHSSRFKSETYEEVSDGGTSGKNGESDVFRTMDSDVNSRDMSVRRPLRPW